MVCRRFFLSPSKALGRKGRLTAVRLEQGRKPEERLFFDVLGGRWSMMPEIISPQFDPFFFEKYGHFLGQHGISLFYSRTTLVFVPYFLSNFHSGYFFNFSRCFYDVHLSVISSLVDNIWAAYGVLFFVGVIPNCFEAKITNVINCQTRLQFLYK